MHAKHVRIIRTPKSIFAYQYHKFSFLFGILFIRIFMRLGKLVQHTRDFSMEKMTCFSRNCKFISHNSEKKQVRIVR